MGLLERLAQNIGARVAQLQAAQDPARWNDPVALTTEWTPLSPGGSSFRTHTLVALEHSRVGFKKSFQFWLFGLLFLGLGLGIAGWGAYSGIWPFGLFGLPFAAAGGFMLLPRPIVFDDATRAFLARGASTPYGSIHAIQILREYVSSKNGGFDSYELNLVLKDGKRLPVIDHGDLDAIRSSASRLATQLGCRVWDTTERKA